MDEDQNVVSLSLLNDEQDQKLLEKISNKSKKIFKIVYSNNKQLIKYKIYNRKEKSLEELSKKFVRCLIDYDEKIVCLDQITDELGVERRRIYDIINILESLQVVKRKCKNKYSWSGFKTIYQTIQQYANKQVNFDTTQHKREKSLEVLSAGFIQLFMQHKSIWTLEEAAKYLGKEVDQNKLKTKVRRLYDIANVLKSIGLIKKTHLISSKKPAFQWVGEEGLKQFQHNLKQQELKNKPQEIKENIAIQSFPQNQNLNKPDNQNLNKPDNQNLSKPDIQYQRKPDDFNNYNSYVDKCIDVLIQQQLYDRKQQTEQKIREQNQNQLTIITPKLRKTYTIIPPRVTTPKKALSSTPKKKQSNNHTPNNKNVVGSLIGKFNQNL
ncbi:unnamed protein product [Paramecium sonneborni]|uniref:E2F/DP family winged-helix DNA-binding domain-containing protein n=1 Tax=Paramecium sonneborni TaxID=65129 RepID=A0A8S1LF76_9CILI|nr:unnamed protein product [Paramecium sonneborni]